MSHLTSPGQDLFTGDQGVDLDLLIQQPLHQVLQNRFHASPIRRVVFSHLKNSHESMVTPDGTFA